MRGVPEKENNRFWKPDFILNFFVYIFPYILSKIVHLRKQNKLSRSWIFAKGISQESFEIFDLIILQIYGHINLIEGPLTFFSKFPNTNS